MARKLQIGGSRLHHERRSPATTNNLFSRSSPATMNELFARDMDLPLQTIFLSLNPPALKNSRLVCVQWGDFIKHRVLATWKKRQLAYHWRHADPIARSVELELDTLNTRVFSLSCDDSVVVCGLNNATAKVYKIETLAHLTDLNCRPLPHDEPHPAFGWVHSDVGQDIVATVTQKGDVSVWKKSDWSLLYKERPHGNNSVCHVKVLPDFIISGAQYEKLALLSWDGESVSLVRMIGDSLDFNCGLDSDSEWILYGTIGNTGNRPYSLKVWSLTNDALAHSYSMDPFRGPGMKTGCSVVLSYPYGVNICSDKVMVWDLRTGQQVRMMDVDKSCVIREIRHNKSILVVANATYSQPWRHSVKFFNLHQITSPELEVPLWMRKKYLDDGASQSIFHVVKSCINTECLVAVQGHRMHIWDLGNCDNFSETPDQ